MEATFLVEALRCLRNGPEIPPVPILAVRNDAEPVRGPNFLQNMMDVILYRLLREV